VPVDRSGGSSRSILRRDFESLARPERRHFWMVDESRPRSTTDERRATHDVPVAQAGNI
jgi:hypothetical protein